MPHLRDVNQTYSRPVIGKDHRFMVRIGHGTDIAQIADLA
jgi:hypothetical protein